MRLLIVDDEKDIRNLLTQYAQFSGYEVDEAADGYEAVKKVEVREPDLIIMDVMMPGLDGFGAVKLIRKHSQVPILMLSARGEEYDKLYGFDLGIDDYVTKPFSPREVMARVGRILLRGKPTPKNVMRIEGLTVDMDSRIVTVDGNKVDLTPKEYELLFYMVLNRGVALSRDRLLNEVWGFEFYGDDRTVDTHIKMLRANLGPYRHLIETVRSVGYRFVQ